MSPASYRGLAIRKKVSVEENLDNCAQTKTRNFFIENTGMLRGSTQNIIKIFVEAPGRLSGLSGYLQLRSWSQGPGMSPTWGFLFSREPASPAPLPATPSARSMFIREND